ncbi:uncharacterized protein Dwil_GK13760 [Drosophila willistoni]|uniref:Uncharacterized protein n=1 Tax=Drosophila willistoni TaxID=7260 RepID=B4NID4_DROWI|nr:uncharacterized protein LOC6650036 [Drosophila willistoni]EDW83716.1 uncharacterized protein Dwil_GK13760 [Drosophila willistoni]
MSNTMTAAHEPIHYLDSILNEEERGAYSHQWRNFTISRSGRFRSKNKKRDAVDGKLFDAAHNSGGVSAKENNEKISSRNTAVTVTATATANMFRSSTSAQTQSPVSGTSAAGNTTRSQRDKTETYKSFYETNL